MRDYRVEGFGSMNLGLRGSLVVFWVEGLQINPKGSQVLLWGILPQIIIVTPNIETLHSTI